MNKVSNKSIKAPMGDMPMDGFSIDVVGPLPRTPRGSNYIGSHGLF